MSGVDQLVASARRGDAITTGALSAREVLRQVGPSQLLAGAADTELRDEVRLIDDEGGPPDDAVPLVLHASIGDEAVQTHVLARRGPVVLHSHGIVPANHHGSSGPELGQDLAPGRHQLVRLRTKVAGAFAVSQHSATELEALGYDDVRVVPPIIRPGRLRDLPVHEGATNHMNVALKGPVILCVAHMLPHERPDLVVLAYHLLVTHHLPEATLIIVGPPRLDGCARTIRALADDLHLPSCWLAGQVEDDVLAAMYRRADVMVVASEHEGLCVPLVEAMAFDVPIVARANASIPETLGGGGLLVDGDAGPGLLAEALLAVISDERLRADLRRRSAARLAAFDPDVAGATLLANLAAVL